MTSVYVTEARAVVRQEAHRLVVTVDERTADGQERRRHLADIVPHQVELLALVGDAHITSDATRFCLGHGIQVAWFGWNGGFLGRLVPESPRNGDLRLAQYTAYCDDPSRLALARAMVSAKVAGAGAVLRRARSNRPGRPVFAAAIAHLERLVAMAEAVHDVDVLLGIEGNAARVYFAALAQAFSGAIRFSGRARRPPPDPANALLSFGYVLLGNLIAGMLEARGLDPAIGFLHEPRQGRASLALDLLEEFRHPVVDRFVLRIANLNILAPADFEADGEEQGGVRLGPAARKRFLAEWETLLAVPQREKGREDRATVRQLLARQVDRLAAALRSGEPYRPFVPAA